MKVIFGGETKRIPEIEKFHELVQHAAKVFNAQQLRAKKNDLKLFYQDDEGDIISVTCQSDLEEAYSIMRGRIKFVFAKDEDTAAESLQKGQAPKNNDSYYQSDYCVRPAQPQSILDRSSISQANSELGPRSPRMMNSQNMMQVMFEQFLQNQIEQQIRMRTMQGQSMLDIGAQANQGKLAVEGGPLEQAPIEPIAENTQEEKSNDLSDQNIDEIVKELDEAHDSSKSQKAEAHSLEEAVIEIPTDTQQQQPEPDIVQRTPSKRAICSCKMGDLCYKCILGKVFSLEPLIEPTYEATCVDQPHEFIGIAGADFNVTCRFKNTGQIPWPDNVQLKLVNGTTIVYNALGLNKRCVQPQGELNVTIEVKFPQTPGKYILSFRLVYGDNIEFGDEATMNVVAKAPTGQVGNIGKPIDYQVLDALEQPLTETNGNTFYVDQDREFDGSGTSVNDLDLSINSWLMVQDGEDAASGTPGAVAKTENEEAPPASQAPCTEVQRNDSDEQEWCEEDEANEDDNYLFAWLKAGCSSIERGVLSLRGGHGYDEKASSQLIDQVE